MMEEDLQDIIEEDKRCASARLRNKNYYLH